MNIEMNMRMQLILDPRKGQTEEKALPEMLRSMADGYEKGQLQGGTPSGGHWAITKRK